MSKMVTKSLATACMLRDEYQENRIYGWFEASIVWSFYKHGRDPLDPTTSEPEDRWWDHNSDPFPCPHCLTKVVWNEQHQCWMCPRCDV